MSSGAARQNDQNNKDSFRAESNPTTPALFRQRGDASAPLATGTGFAAPRVGALLVEAYGKAVRKQLAFSPDTVQLEYIRFLVREVREWRRLCEWINSDLMSIRRAGAEQALVFNCQSKLL